MSDLDKAAEITAKLIEQGIVDAPQAEPAKIVEVEPEVLVESAPAEQFSEIEVEAMKKRWKPDGPKSADEFLRAEPLYEEIKKRGKEIKTLRSQVDELMKHVSNLKKAGYEEKLDMIKHERANAIARSDIDSVDYLDEQLYAVKAELQQVQQQQTPELHPAAQAFVQKYNDLIQDKSEEASEIKAFIDFKDKQLGAKGLDPVDHMKTLEQQLLKRYPERFKSEERAAPVYAVESDSAPVGSRKRSKYSFSDLSPDQKNIYKHMEKRGVMSGADYIKQLVEIGELK